MDASAENAGSANPRSSTDNAEQNAFITHPLVRKRLPTGNGMEIVCGKPESLGDSASRQFPVRAAFRLRRCAFARSHRIG
jgi:hypothetical protein